MIGIVLVLRRARVTQPQSVGLGVAVGVALTCLNFFVLRRLVVKWTRHDAAAGKSAAAPLLMMPKMMILLMGAVAASLCVPPPIDPVRVHRQLFDLHSLDHDPRRCPA